MPCRPKRARKLIERRDATPYWSHGIFCIRLNREPSARNKQAVVVGVDPGSKREGFSARSAAHDLLNIDADAKGWVGKKLEGRRILRRARRSRKTPCRSPKRTKENHDRIPAGTRARWHWKLQVLQWLATLYPVSDVAVRGHRCRDPEGGEAVEPQLQPARERQEVVLRRGRKALGADYPEGSRDGRTARGVRPEENKGEDERPVGRTLRRRLDAGRERPEDREQAATRRVSYGSRRSSDNADACIGRTQAEAGYGNRTVVRTRAASRLQHWWNT